MSDESRKRAKQEYYRARADNIKNQVSVHQILDFYDIPIRTQTQEVQFPCPLHGDGDDDHYSGRAYPETEGDPGGHTYCWACHKSRDVIEWVRDKESLSFVEAMKFIENRFNITDVPNIYEYFDPNANEDDDNDGDSRRQTKFDRELDRILSERDLNRDDLSFVERKIDRLVESQKQNLKMESVFRLYHTYDRVIYDINEGRVSASKAQDILSQLISKVNEISSQ